MALVATFVPIWLLAAAGYAARWWRPFGRPVLGDRATAALGWFVFHLAVPATIYLTLAKSALAGFGGAPLAAFALSTAVVLGAGWVAAGKIFGRKPGERVIWAMAGGYVNSANLGIPVALRILGNLSFLIEVVLLQVLIVTPVILTALDSAADAEGQGGQSGRGGRVRLRRLATLPLRNPVLLASVLGIAASLTRTRLPGALAEPLALLAATAVPAALVALGATLYSPAAQPAGVPTTPGPDGVPGAAGRTGRVPRGAADPSRGEICVIALLKLIGQPAVAWAAGALAFRLAGPELLAVVVCAALPTAQNAFNFAQQYRVAEALAGRAVLVTTTLSLVTILGAAALLGR